MRGRQILADAGAGDHAAISDEYDLLQTETVAKLVNLSGHGFGIGGVALEDFDGNGWIGVIVDDDPAAEFHRWYGRHLWFHPDEVEPVEH